LLIIQIEQRTNFTHDYYTSSL